MKSKNNITRCFLPKIPTVTFMEIYMHCVKSIEKITKNGMKKCYIGITYNPRKRLKSHKNDESCKDLRCMCLLDEGITCEYAKLLETLLILKFDDYPWLTNETYGSEGITHNDNYDYIMLKKKPNK